MMQLICLPYRSPNQISNPAI